MNYTKMILWTLITFSFITGVIAFLNLASIPYRSLLIPGLWALGALIPVLMNKVTLSSLGLTCGDIIKGLKYYLLSMILFLPIFYIGSLSIKKWGILLAKSTIPSGVALSEWIVYQFMFIAVFEELFFRGYLQQKAKKISGRIMAGGKKIFWTPIIVSAILFGLAHMIVSLNPLRFMTFFPGLLFGWLKAKTGSLVAPVLSHGSANVVTMFLLRTF